MSKSPYFLKDIFGERAEIEIDCELALQIEDAGNFLSVCSRLEDLFSLVAISYREFETFVYMSGLNEMVDGSSSTGEPLEHKYGRYRDEANQKFLNLANSYRALCDQAPQRLSKGEKHCPSIGEHFQQLMSQAFDTHLAFRLFDFLRNMSTHHALPVTDATLRWDRLSPNGDHESSSIGRVSLELTVRKDVILGLPKGRSKTKKEVSGISEDKLDLKSIVRGFVAAQFEMRKEFHSESMGALEEAENTFERAYVVYKERNGQNAKFLELYKVEDGKYRRITPVKSTLPELVMQLRSRWQGLPYVRQRYASTEIADLSNVFRVSSDGLWIK